MKEQQVFSLPQPWTIPERIIGVKSQLIMTFNGSVTEVVTPHIGWDGDGHWVVDVGAGTY